MSNTTIAVTASLPPLQGITPYSPAAKGLLPLVGLIGCPLLAALFYYYGRRHLNQDETVSSRSDIYYSAMTGTAVALFVSHVFLRVTTRSSVGAVWMTAFILLGYMAAIAYERIHRVWNDNPTNYVGPRADIDVDGCFDKNSMSRQPYVHMEDLSNPEENANVGLSRADEEKELNKRFAVSIAVFVVMCGFAIMDGIFLVTHPYRDVALAVGMFFGAKMQQSTLVFGSLIHAQLLHEENGKKRMMRWVLFTTAWSLVVFCSVIPILADAPYLSLHNTTRHALFSVPFGISGGILLWVTGYFNRLQPDVTSMKRTLISLGVLAANVLAVWSTALVQN